MIYTNLSCYNLKKTELAFKILLDHIWNLYMYYVYYLSFFWIKIFEVKNSLECSNLKLWKCSIVYALKALQNKSLPNFYTFTVWQIKHVDTFDSKA